MTDLPAPALSDDEIIALGEGFAVVRDDVMPDAMVMACRAWIQQLIAQARLTPALLGRARHHRPELRGDWSCWLEEAGDHPMQRQL
ncbi:MAG: hypothetical protein P8R54_07250, partial [Myxococcota bacterium]|nr:hypothetical protein [Myxococcota bacterium]